jgi:methionyl-tRNA synthetase
VSEANANVIQYDYFSNIELKVATVLEASEIPKADKLVKLKVSLGTEERQIVAGIKLHYSPESLVGKQIVIVTNLEPRALRGEVSHGMLLAASDDEGNLSLITVDKLIKPGSQIK